MSDKKKSIIVENIEVLTTPEGFQKYILGTKEDGTPRALYDIISDYTNPKKKKKKDKKKNKNSDVPTSAYGFYLSSKKSKKKKKKKNKHWHI